MLQLNVLDTKCGNAFIWAYQIFVIVIEYFMPYQFQIRYVAIHLTVKMMSEPYNGKMNVSEYFFDSKNSKENFHI